MNRQQLAHLLRSVCTIVDDDDVLVLGSQSILGSFDEDDLPPEATASQEADLAFLDDPDRQKADQVEAAIGEMSAFHDQNGVYAEGIHVDTATLPEGWRDRLVGWDLQSSHPAKPHFLEPHDLAVAKLAAGRGKDKAFVDALIRTGMLDVAVIRERAHLLADSVDPRVGQHVHGWLDYYDGGKGRRPASSRRATTGPPQPRRPQGGVPGVGEGHLATVLRARSRSDPAGAGCSTPWRVSVEAPTQPERPALRRSTGSLDATRQPAHPGGRRRHGGERYDDHSCLRRKRWDSPERLWIWASRRPRRRTPAGSQASAIGGGRARLDRVVERTDPPRMVKRSVMSICTIQAPVPAAVRACEVVTPPDG